MKTIWYAGDLVVYEALFISHGHQDHAFAQAGTGFGDDVPGIGAPTEIAADDLPPYTFNPTPLQERRENATAALLAADEAGFGGDQVDTQFVVPHQGEYDAEERGTTHGIQADHQTEEDDATQGFSPITDWLLDDLYHPHFPDMNDPTPMHINFNTRGTFAQPQSDALAPQNPGPVHALYTNHGSEMFPLPDWFVGTPPSNDETAETKQEVITLDYNTTAGTSMLSQSEGRHERLDPIARQSSSANTPSTSAVPPRGIDNANLSVRANSMPRKRKADSERPSRNGEFYCETPGCTYTQPFKRKDMLNRHKKSVHDEADGKYYCLGTNCSYENARSDKMRDHVRRCPHGATMFAFRFHLMGD